MARCTCTQAHRSAAVGDSSGLGVEGDKVTVAAWDPETVQNNISVPMAS